MMSVTENITKTISQYIETQFPAIYREDGEILVSFITAYYEYLEDNRLLNREMFTIKDIDNTFDDFIVFFRRKYIDGFPFLSATDERFLIKNIIDFYRAKGSEQSIKLLFRLLLDQDVDVYYPREDILRASDSLWDIPRYLEVSYSNDNINLIEQTITGSKSGAKAFVEGLVTKRVDGKLIDVLYLSDIKGNFEVPERVIVEGKSGTYPVILGSLSEIKDIETIETDNKVGDIVKIVSDTNNIAIGRISRVLETTDRVTINLFDGGYGYTLDSDTNIFISDTNIVVEPFEGNFEDLEQVIQPLETITVDVSANTILLAEIGDDVIGIDTANNQVATGKVIDIGADFVEIQVDEGSFSITLDLETDSPFPFLIGELIEQSSEYSITMGSTAGYEIGEQILQRSIDPSSGFYVDLAFGTIQDIDNDNLIIQSGYGEFKEDFQIEGMSSGFISSIQNIVVNEQGALGSIVGVDGTTVTVKTEIGGFDVSKPIRGSITRNEVNLSSISQSSLMFISINGDEYDVLSFANTSASGIFVDGSRTSLGIKKLGTNDFKLSDDIETFIVGTKSNTKAVFNKIGAGFGASFEIDSISHQEEVEVGVDFIGDTNLAGRKYLDIGLNPGGYVIDPNEPLKHSGVGKVLSIDIIDGGLGYANNTIAEFTGGGYIDAEPIIPAEAVVLTDDDGVITNLLVINPGQGYFETPDITIPGGSISADVTVNMQFGYGFPKQPFSNLNTPISDALETKISTIGSIERLTNIKPGRNYDVLPYFNVENPVISRYNVLDIIAKVDDIEGGSFSVGNIISGTNDRKGRIREISSDGSVLTIRNLSFTNRFDKGDSFTSDTGVSAKIIDVDFDSSTSVMGKNAVTRAFVVLSSGTIAEVEIISSGYGFDDKQRLSIFSNDNLIAVANPIKGSQGRDIGFWRTNTSELNNKRLHDNFFYQEYSYQIQTELSLTQYESLVRNILHVSGMELFGAIRINRSNSIEIDSDSEILKGIAVFQGLEFIGDFNTANVQFTDIFLDARESGVGRVLSIRVNEGGTGYSNSDIVTISGGGFEGGAPFVNAEASVITDSDGSITSIAIISSGAGYFDEPSVSISGGVGVDFDVIMEFGYGFVKKPFSNLTTDLADAFSVGEIDFFEIITTETEGS